jgi:hypothetical protein
MDSQFLDFDDYHRYTVEQRAIGRMLSMFKHQEREMTPTMLVFDGQCDAEYSIKIIEEKGGWITANVRLRVNGHKPLFTTRVRSGHFAMPNGCHFWPLNRTRS